VGFQVASTAAAQGVLPVIHHLDKGQARDALQPTTRGFVDAALASQVAVVVKGYSQLRLAQRQCALGYQDREVL
jgi:hypothetical protein